MRIFGEAALPGTKIHDLIDLEALGCSPKEDIRSQPQMVILDKIERGHDCCTTIMIRNIPNKMHAGDLKEWLSSRARTTWTVTLARLPKSTTLSTWILRARTLHRLPSPSSSSVLGDVRPGPHNTIARPGPHATPNGVRCGPNLSTNDIRNTPSPACRGVTHKK
ncbi:hypothetical protein BDV97DRAFT_395914 [Delphinella strobiligena]|nr:hypothetical protein BDV97DRAFT_395914 [Delphinella strobiligena]